MHILTKTAGGALLLALAVAPRAGAQDVLSTPDAVRACLCHNQTVAALAAALKSERQTYDDQKQALDKLEHQASAARQHLDPDNLAEREALGRLLDQRDAASERLAGTVTPHYNATVRRYDAAVSAFNGMCAGKAYDPTTLADIQASLVCPTITAGLDPVIALR